MKDTVSNPCSGFVRPSLPVAVERHLRELIARGAFDDRLPGERRLALMLKVCRTTVREALVNLVAEGALERSRGKATRIRRKIPEPANAGS